MAVTRHLTQYNLRSVSTWMDEYNISWFHCNINIKKSFFHYSLNIDQKSSVELTLWTLIHKRPVLIIALSLPTYFILYSWQSSPFSIMYHENLLQTSKSMCLKRWSFFGFLIAPTKTVNPNLFQIPKPHFRVIFCCIRLPKPVWIQLVMNFCNLFSRW